jgi:hypothetical protein
LKIFSEEIKDEFKQIAAKIVGVLFKLAAVSAVIGLNLFDPIFNGRDYLINGSEHENQVILGRREAI